MRHADFVHLRLHSAYSLSEGAVRVKEAVGLARHHGMPALAITDTGNLFGALEFAFAAAEAGVQPIIGCEMALSRATDAPLGAREAEPDRIVLLAQDESGYRNLMALTSAAFLETEPPRMPQVGWSKLATHAESLIALTGGLRGPVGRLAGEERGDAAAEALAGLAGLFPGRLYMELQRHGLDDEDRIEPALVDLAYAQDVPLVATNEVFFADDEMYEAHDVLLCVAEGAYLSESNRRRVTPEHRFKSAEEMRVLFEDLPEAVDNTLVVAQRCAYMPPRREPILPRYEVAAGRTEGEELRARAEAGLAERLAERPEEARAPHVRQLEHELEVIGDMGFGGYFLVVADFIRFAHEAEIPVGPGRGSGAGSVVAWALRITDLDPLQFGLLFERFLNPHRVSMPDFDIDFCQERRDEVIHYVQQQYGADRVAQIITFGTLQARAALRDVGRVLEISYGHVDRICKMVPYNPAQPVSLADAIEREPRLGAEAKQDERVARMLDIAQKLEGLYRHASTHAAGVVIGDRPLTELVPLYRDPRSDMPVTQFSMKYVEQAGLVKFDFLGLKTLTVIDRAVRLLKQRGIELDVATLPLDDAETYAMLARGETIGVFQLESAGMRDLAREVQPGGIEDIIAIVALYRPGPMENIPKYVACKHGREEPERLHDLIAPVVADTYGVIIYQEQVMQIAQVFAGFTMAEADVLRRAMGKKIKAEMRALRDRFIEGAQAKGVSAERASHVFGLVDKFAGYGFNKAHSAGYAVIAYQTAYLKAHHPVEFLAASMTVDMGNTEKLSVFADEARRLGIPMLPPDVNRSGVEFAVEEAEDALAIRYALAAVRNVGVQAMTTLTAERTSNGPFADLGDFANRIEPRVANRRQIENLARAGAFDSLHGNRAEAVAGVETLVRHAAAAAADRDGNQASLFGDGGMPAERGFVLPAEAPWNSIQALEHEHDALGFYLSAHPVSHYAGVLAAKRVVSAADIPERVRTGATALTLAGTVRRKRERRMASGGRFAHVELSDPTGNFEVTVFSELLAQIRDLLEPGTSVLVDVGLRAGGDDQRLTASRMESLDEFAQRQATALAVTLADAAPLADLQRILGEGNGGGATVSIVVRPLAAGREVEIALPGGFGLTPAVLERIRRTPGVLDLSEE